MHTYYRKKTAPVAIADGNNKEIDYKDVELLKSYVMESGRIIPSRITGASAKTQRQIARAVKLARFLALLAYTDQQ